MAGIVASDVYHQIDPQDCTTMGTIRELAAPSKGVLERDAFDKIIEHTSPALGVDYQSATVGGIPGWWCRPSDRNSSGAILYLHGGAYMLGRAKSYRNMVGQIARRAGRAAFVPDYALAPDRPFPAAVRDALSVYIGLEGEGFNDVVLAGDSSGD